MKIIVEKPKKEQLENMGVFSWPIWEKEKSTFPWYYDEKETCYFLEGKVRVTPEGQKGIEIKKGDFVTFPKGMKCTWEILSAVKKHYKFG